MAKCRFCGRRVPVADGCIDVKLGIRGKAYDRVRVGGPGDFTVGRTGNPGSFRCGDCGAKYGAFHHPGCGMEACPRCGQQLVSCSCNEILLQYPFCSAACAAAVLKKGN